MPSGNGLQRRSGHARVLAIQGWRAYRRKSIAPGASLPRGKASDYAPCTLVLPFDDAFGFASVFHKPALNSSLALRNILKHKRLLFWDDYQPLLFGQKFSDVFNWCARRAGRGDHAEVMPVDDGAPVHPSFLAWRGR